MTTLVAEQATDRIRGPRPSLSVVTFNVSATQRGDQLRANLPRMIVDAGTPKVVALQEAYGLHASVPGYRLVGARGEAAGGRPDALGCQLLVRDGVPIARRWILRVEGPWWVGPHQGHKHPPRVYVGVTVESGGRRWDVLDVHRVPGGFARNREAYVAEDRALLGWVLDRREEHPHRPIVLPGDWQHPPTEHDRLRPWDVARRIGGHMAFAGIDGVISTGAKPTRTRELPGLYGSDSHQPVRVDLEAPHRPG